MGVIRPSVAISLILLRELILRGALEAYEAEGIDNGVTVAVGKVSDRAAAETSFSDPFIRDDDQTGNITVRQTESKAFRVGAAVAHGLGKELQSWWLRSLELRMERGRSFVHDAERNQGNTN